MDVSNWFLIGTSYPIQLNPIPIGYQSFYFYSDELRLGLKLITYKIKDLLIQQVKYI